MHGQFSWEMCPYLCKGKSVCVKTWRDCKKPLDYRKCEDYVTLTKVRSAMLGVIKRIKYYDARYSLDHTALDVLREHVRELKSCNRKCNRRACEYRRSCYY